MELTTKERILEAAMDLFSRDGYNAVSIRDITRAVGIKESSLYNHFRNKEEILETILANFRSAFARTRPPAELLDRLLAETDLQSFLEQGFAIFRRSVDDPAIGRTWRIVQMEQFRVPQAREIIVKDIYGDTMTFLETVFAKLVAIGKVRPLAPRVLAAEYQMAIFGMMSQYTILRFDGQSTAEVESRLAEHLEFFINAVSLPKEESQHV